MIGKVNGILVLGAMLLASTAFGQARPTAKCETGKTKCVVNKVKGDLGCYGKGAKLGLAADPNCLLKAENKWDLVVLGVAKGCMTKADAKNATVPCLTLNDATPIDAKISTLESDLITNYYTNPAPNGLNPCFAGQAKCVTNYVKGTIGCYQKAVKGGLPVDANCINKVNGKFTGSATSCMEKLDAPTKACTTTGTPGVGGAVKTLVDAFLDDVRAEMMPDNVLRQVTTLGAGPCGQTDAGGPALQVLNCGDLSIGAGTSSVPPGATPAGSTNLFAVLGGTAVSGAPVSWGQRQCSSNGCKFGSPLPIENGPLSTCVDNTFSGPASGTLNATLGTFTGTIPLFSTTTVTSNSTQPCPHCVAGVCDSSAANSGAPCKIDATSGESHDCVSVGPVLSPFPVNLVGITTASSSMTNAGGIFCPAQGQVSPGAFGQPTATHIIETGSPAGNLTVGPPMPAKLGSVFCIPATGSGLIDGSADLPGPGAVALVVTIDLQ